MMRRKNSDNPNLRGEDAQPCLTGPQSDQSDRDTAAPQEFSSPVPASRERSRGILCALKHPLMLWAWLSSPSQGTLPWFPARFSASTLDCFALSAVPGPQKVSGHHPLFTLSLLDPGNAYVLAAREARCLFEASSFEMQTYTVLTQPSGRTWGEGWAKLVCVGSWGLPCPFALEKGRVGKGELSEGPGGVSLLGILVSDLDLEIGQRSGRLPECS